MAADEKDLVRRFQDGEPGAFEQLYTYYGDRVYRFCYRLCGHTADAEDLAQEVFIHLYQNLGSIESPAHLKFWLRRVTSHRCIDYARKQRMKTVSVDDAPEPVAPSDFRDSLMTAALRRIVATLPEKPRLVVTLRYQEDLDPSEIAELLGMPLNTVKSHLRRSLVILREKVTRSLGEMKV